MNRFQKRLGSSFLVVASVLCSCDSNRDKPARPQPTTARPIVRLAYLKIGSDLPYFVGASKMIFAKHGLEVRGVRLGDSNQVVEALLSGQIDAADITGSSVVLAEAVRKPGAFKVFMASMAGANSNIHQLIARKDTGIESIRDLAGRRLAVFPGSQMRAYVQLVLRHFLEPPQIANVVLVPLTPPQQIQAMRDGQVDAVLALEPTGTEIVSARLGKRIGNNVLFEYVSKPEPFLTAYGLLGTAWASKNPAAARALVEAYGEITAYIADHPGDARQVLAVELGVDAEVARETSLYEYLVVPALTPTAVAASVKVMVDAGVLERAPDLGSFLYAIE